MSGIGPCVLPVDEQGRPLRPGILYGIDTRATGQIAALERDPGFDPIFELNGQIPTTQSAGPKIRWIRENEPDLYQKTCKFLGAPSYLIHRLTGEFVTSRHEASYATPLVDLDRLEYDDRFAGTICPIERPPRAAWSTEIAGTVTARAAAETGLQPGTPVNAGAIDAAAEALSVGVIDPDLDDDVWLDPSHSRYRWLPGRSARLGQPDTSHRAAIRSVRACRQLAADALVPGRACRIRSNG
ncbi:MAG: FGGY family carbohydrate kinase [Thermomicrobiales bacterium]